MAVNWYVLAGFLVLAKEKILPGLYNRITRTRLLHTLRKFISMFLAGAFESRSQARGLVISICKNQLYKILTESLALAAGRAGASSAGFPSLINTKVDFMCISRMIVLSVLCYYMFCIKSFEFTGICS